VDRSWIEWPVRRRRDASVSDPQASREELEPHAANSDSRRNGVQHINGAALSDDRSIRCGKWRTTSAVIHIHPTSPVASKR